MGCSRSCEVGSAAVDPTTCIDFEAVSDEVAFWRGSAEDHPTGDVAVEFSDDEAGGANSSGDEAMVGPPAGGPEGGEGAGQDCGADGADQPIGTGGDAEAANIDAMMEVAGVVGNAVRVRF